VGSSLRRAKAARRLSGALFSLAAVAIVTAAIFALKALAPVLSLGVLYVFAVLPVAVIWGLAYAVAVSIASMLAFNWLFLPPTHTFELRESENWVALAVYLITAVVVSELAARSRRRAADAEQREREASLLTEVSSGLLRSGDVQAQLREIATRTTQVLGAERGWIELESVRRPEATESAHDLVAGERFVGRLFLEAGATPNPAVKARVLPALASLLAVAKDRERLGRKALEAEALRRSDAIKTAILRAVSHDLRSPLTAIRAASEGLESPALDLTPEDRAELLETIRVEVKRLDHLVGNLLDLSRLEAGAARPRPRVSTVDDLLARALDAAGADAERVSVALAAETPLVYVDADQIERVLVNLLENALKFSPPGEPVEVTVENSESEIVVRVSDRGPGVAPDELERVFDAFARARTDESARGTGLGLAIARGFAQVNGGRLWIESTTDQGATFALALPVADVPAPAPVA
jgi:two-component system sensor histidine kinase KdpD